MSLPDIDPGMPISARAMLKGKMKALRAMGPESCEPSKLSFAVCLFPKGFSLSGTFFRSQASPRGARKLRLLRSVCPCWTIREDGTRHRRGGMETGPCSEEIYSHHKVVSSANQRPYRKNSSSGPIEDFKRCCRGAGSHGFLRGVQRGGLLSVFAGC